MPTLPTMQKAPLAVETSIVLAMTNIALSLEPKAKRRQRRFSFSQWNEMILKGNSTDVTHQSLFTGLREHCFIFV